MKILQDWADFEFNPAIQIVKEELEKDMKLLMSLKEPHRKKQNYFYNSSHRELKYL